MLRPSCKFKPFSIKKERKKKKVRVVFYIICVYCAKLHNAEMYLLQ